jgi:hypothetical protein
LLSHRGWDFKKQGKKKYTGLQLGMKLSLAANSVLNLSLPSPFFSWTPSTNRCCCYVYCSYICFGAWCILSLSISYPYLIKFHYFADNSQEGMKHQIGGATQGQQGMTLQAGKCNVEHSILLPDEVQLNFTAGLTK